MLVLLAIGARAATLTVCPSSCDHATLQDAWDASVDGGVIEVLESVSGAALLGGSKSVTVVGVGSPVLWYDPAADTADDLIVVDAGTTLAMEGVVLSGSGVARVVRVDPGAVVTLVDAEVRDGIATYGGGLYAEVASVTLEACWFHDNAATAGGALYAEDSDVVVLGGQLDGNQATWAATQLYATGGTLSLVGTAVRNDDARTALEMRECDAVSVDGIVHDGVGAGIFLVPAGTATVLRSEFCGSPYVALEIDASGSVPSSAVVANNRFVDGGDAIYVSTPSAPLSIEVTQNHFVAGADAAAALSVGSGVTAYAANNVVVGYQGGKPAFDADDPVDLTLSANLFYGNDIDYDATFSGSEQVFDEDPLFLSFQRNGACDDDVRSFKGSPTFFAGEGTDAEGLPYHIGAWGGPEADSSDADVDGHPVGEDCDDGDPDIHWDAADLCADGIDQDCDGSDGDLTLYTVYPDADGDGFGDADSEGWQTCDPEEGALDAGDCDDASAAVYPGADELCDGVDDNCDGETDELLPTRVWYTDTDGDGWGDEAAVPVESCLSPEDAYSDRTGDCDDARGEVHPGATDSCGALGEDRDCDGEVLPCRGSDGDGDGFCAAAFCVDGATPGDCDDSDLDVHPLATEVCGNGVDDDCDGGVDDRPVWDRDRDGHTSTESCAGSADDCRDDLATVHPGHEDVCNGLDDDCDGATDEAVDADLDGYSATASACGGALPADCDDERAAAHPGAAERANGSDDDCDGSVDEDPLHDDDDGDGYCENAPCTNAFLSGDCDDSDPAVSPLARDVADGRDNDCDGSTDVLDTVDADDDGASPADGDCDDSDPEVHPAADELCNGRDDDCDGVFDLEELDRDGDGRQDCAGACVPSLELCNGLDDDCDGLVDEGFDADGDGSGACGDCAPSCDCDDGNAWVHPRAVEVCTDGLDNDCDGTTDAGADLDGDGYTPCSGDCDESNDQVHRWASEWCNGKDDDCDAEMDETFDEDGDGVASCSGDCDDVDPERHPYSADVCDDVDNDCDGAIDPDWPDADGDGYTFCGGDCNDRHPGANPAESERCDGAFDEDCDGTVDEDCVGVDTDADSASEDTDAPPVSVDAPRFLCGSPTRTWNLAFLAFLAPWRLKRRTALLRRPNTVPPLEREWKSDRPGRSRT